MLVSCMVILHSSLLWSYAQRDECGQCIGRHSIPEEAALREIPAIQFWVFSFSLVVAHESNQPEAESRKQKAESRKQKAESRKRMRCRCFVHTRNWTAAKSLGIWPPNILEGGRGMHDSHWPLLDMGKPPSPTGTPTQVGSNETQSTAILILGMPTAISNQQ